MNEQNDSTQDRRQDEAAVAALYRALLDCWNRRDPKGFADLFAEDATVIGFDGSQMTGPDEIRTALGQIFADHQTAAYIGKIRGVRFPIADAAILLAVSGLVPPGKSDLNPATNAIQALVAAREQGKWWIHHYQNTPAAYHGRPDLSDALTAELRELI